MTYTFDEDHNKLGIINRFMRVIRDMQSREHISVAELVDSYIDMPHRSLNNKSPNEITKEYELTYIHEMEHHVNPCDSVWLILDKSPLAKHRMNLSQELYIIDSTDGNQFIMRAADGSVDTVPGYKIVKAQNVL